MAGYSLSSLTPSLSFWSLHYAGHGPFSKNVGVGKEVGVDSRAELVVLSIKEGLTVLDQAGWRWRIFSCQHVPRCDALMVSEHHKYEMQ